MSAIIRYGEVKLLDLHRNAFYRRCAGFEQSARRPLAPRSSSPGERRVLHAWTVQSLSVFRVTAHEWATALLSWFPRAAISFWAAVGPLQRQLRLDRDSPAIPQRS